MINFGTLGGGMISGRDDAPTHRPLRMRPRFPASAYAATGSSVAAPDVVPAVVSIVKPLFGV